MNILFVSHLSNNIAAGLNWSVPASVNAQSKIDNVLWIDITDAFLSHWAEVEAYHNVREYGKLKLRNLPSPFNNPDLVVFEGFYEPRECFFALSLRNKKIPYIIVPRGSLTHQAMNNRSKWKKKIAHWILFNSFVHHAAAIQYLTEAEYCDSGNKWNLHHIIVPNGFDIPKEQKTEFSCGIKAIFIGRLDLYHKGLDLLLKIMADRHKMLMNAHFSLTLYGPQKYDYCEIQKFIKKHDISDIVHLGGEIFGEKKQKAILDADIMIMPSRFEGLPMGLLETMAYGLPCLVSQGTNLADVVAEYNAGWCCDNSLESLDMHLLQMLNEKELLIVKGSNAKKLAANYSWHKIARQFHNNVTNYL